MNINTFYVSEQIFLILILKPFIQVLEHLKHFCSLKLLRIIESFNETTKG